MRAAYVDLKGLLDRSKWEDSAAAAVDMVWFTDCRSLSDALNREVFAKINDKRLGIELAALRQSLWRKAGTASALARLLDERPVKTTDEVVWIDTAAMLTERLTKKMSRTLLENSLGTNLWSIAQPAESAELKRRKQDQRRKAKAFVLSEGAATSERASI